MLLYLTAEELARVDREIQEDARREFARNKSLAHHFVAVVLLPGGRAIWERLDLPPSDFNSQDRKKYVVEVARRFVDLVKPAAFYFVAEQWKAVLHVVKGEEPEQAWKRIPQGPNGLRVEYMAGRQEVLAIHRELPDGSAIVWHAPIIRPKTGRPFAGQFEVLNGELTGRFTDFYWPAGAPRSH